MRVPVTLRVRREEARLTPHTALCVWRLEGTLTPGPLRCGFAFATPYSVRETTPEGARFRPVGNTLLDAWIATLATALFVASIAVRAIALLRRRRRGRGRQNER